MTARWEPEKTILTPLASSARTLKAPPMPPRPILATTWNSSSTSEAGGALSWPPALRSTSMASVITPSHESPTTAGSSPMLTDPSGPTLTLGAKRRCRSTSSSE